MKRLVWVFLAVGALAACSAVDVAHSPAAATVPTPATIAVVSSDPTCNAATDCAAGEACISGYCQMQPCSNAKPGAAPLGTRGVLASYRELIAVTDSGLHPYTSSNGAFTASDFAVSQEVASVIDVAAGDLLGAGPEAIAFATTGVTTVTILHGDDRSDLDVGLTPVAIAAGDLDGDAIAELVAVAADGTAAICHLTTCNHVSFGAAVMDVAIADIDGDGTPEAIALADKQFITLDITGKTRATYATTVSLTHFGAGVLGASTATIAGLEDGGYFGYASDTLHFYAVKDGQAVELGTRSVDGSSSDILVSDLDADGTDEVTVLEGGSVEVFAASGADVPASLQKSTLDGIGTITHLGMGDVDGDSPIATLHGDPQPVPGPMIPVALLTYPPYSTDHSDGTAQIIIGDSDTTSTADASTVALKASLALGFEASFADIVKTTVTARVERNLATTKTITRSMAVGDKFTVDADKGLEGPDNAVAVVASACFQAFSYDIVDPKGHLGDGADGHGLTVFVPSGGQTSVWSLKRYDALAVVTKNLPQLHVPYVAGNPTTYPAAAQTVEGSPIAAEDLILSGDHAYRTSDVAKVGWTLDMTQSKADTTSESTAVSVRGQLKVGPIVAETELGGSFGTAYTVQVGHTTSFAGMVPPVPDDPKTPDDEAALFGYGFSPIVYRDHYQTPAGDDGGLFVVTYTVPR